MSSAEILDQLRALPAGERHHLVTQIWDEFADSELDLTEGQAAELDRRLDDHQRRPNDVVTWADIKAAAEAKHRRAP